MQGLSWRTELGWSRLVTDVGCLAIVMAMVGSGVAAAADKGLAVHPVVLAEGSDEEARQAQAILEKELRTLEVQMADASAVQRFLGALRAKSCSASAQVEKCLGELARSAQAVQALLVSLSLYGGKLGISAKLVNADGSVAVSASRSAPSALPAERWTRFRKELQYVLATEVMPLLNESSDSNPAPAQSVAKSGGGPSRTVAYVVGAVGLIGLGTGVGLMLSGRSAGAEVDGLYDGGRPTEADVTKVDELVRRARTEQTAGAIVGVAGAAALLTGATLLWLAPPAAQAPVTAGVVVAPGGAGVSIQGSW